MNEATLRDTAARATSWLTQVVWPLWLERGVDWKAGGFIEYLDPTTFTCDAEFRRLRVVARQIHVFSHAAALGVSRADDAVALGLGFLEGSARQQDGGYANCFDLMGKVTDTTLSLYNHAFVLLAFTSAGLRREALDLIEFIERRFRHPVAGYFESIPPRLPRCQNSHLHLYEACLAAAAQFNEDIFLTRAIELRRLFVHSLFQSPQGVLPEFFDDHLNPKADSGRYPVEPGHHCEWVSLLAKHPRLPRDQHEPRELAPICNAAMTFVHRYGIDSARGTLYDGVWSDGALRVASSRLWPQAERLKAECVRSDANAERIADAYAGLAVHIEGAPPGLWRERLTASGAWLREPAPATSLYHLTGAILESHVSLKKGLNPPT